MVSRGADRLVCEEIIQSKGRDYILTVRWPALLLSGRQKVVKAVEHRGTSQRETNNISSNWAKFRAGLTPRGSSNI